MGRHALVALALVVAAFALVAAGCGDDDEETSSTAAWAEDFCAKVTEWQDEIEQIGDDLLSLQSRAAAFRPLTVVREMEAQAQAQYFGKIKELEDELQKTTENLQKLQKSQGAGAKGAQILSPEQQTELESFRKKVAETRKELKDLRKNLRQDAERLVFLTKVANIALMPILVALLGILIALLRRRQQARALAA